VSLLGVPSGQDVCGDVIGKIEVELSGIWTMGHLAVGDEDGIDLDGVDPD